MTGPVTSKPPVGELITALAGLFIVLRPGEGASVLTIFLGVMFLIGGIIAAIVRQLTKHPEEFVVE